AVGRNAARNGSNGSGAGLQLSHAEGEDHCRDRHTASRDQPARASAPGAVVRLTCNSSEPLIGNCTTIVKRHEALHGALSTAGLVFAPPRDLEGRLRKAVHREAKPSSLSVLRPWRWAALPLAATLAAALSWSVAV